MTLKLHWLVECAALLMDSIFFIVFLLFGTCETVADLNVVSVKDFS